MSRNSPQEIERLEQQIENVRRKYLTARGWKSVCNTPGAYWLWERILPDNRVLIVDTNLAMSMTARASWAFIDKTEYKQD